MERGMNLNTLHSNFFSSLKQVEKRLKLDNSSLLQPSMQPNHASIDSLTSPLYLFVDQNHSNVGVKCSNFDDSSEFPNEFLSNSVDFPLSDENPGRKSEQNYAGIVSSVDFPLIDENPGRDSVCNDAKLVNCGEVGLSVDDSEIPVELLSNSVDFPLIDQNPGQKSEQNDDGIVNCVEKDVVGMRLLMENSETPVEFRLNSIEFTQTNENRPRTPPQNDAQMVNYVNDGVDEIRMLIELLGLSEREEDEVVNMTCSSCHCGGGFYEKVVGIKGPKCGKEMERLDGWVKHFRGEKIEPFRLAHLLLGKATCLEGDGGGGFEAVEFPSTVEEFLRHDPYMKSKQEGNNGISGRGGGGSDQHISLGWHNEPTK